MKILVDADACPVKEIIVECAKNYNIAVTMFIDTSHVYYDGYSRVKQVDTAGDSVDLAIINEILSGDIAVTQDYGLAAVLLSKGAHVINQNGFLYTNENIDRLLFERHISKEMRRAKRHTGRIKKRTKENDEKFRECFLNLLNSLIEGQ